jgi:hypothetical protein
MTMRLNPLYAPDGIMSGSRAAERFDDGLVHNHHWAVTADEAYPSQAPLPATERPIRQDVSPFQSHRGLQHAHDRHDDGLVHNHDWAVSGK